MPGTKPDDLTKSTGIQVVQRKDQLPKVVLWPHIQWVHHGHTVHMCKHIHSHILCVWHMHMHTLNRCKNVKYNLIHEIRTWVLAWKMAQSVQTLAVQAWWCQSPRTHIKCQLQGLVSRCMLLIPSLSRQRGRQLGLHTKFYVTQGYIIISFPYLWSQHW